MNKEKSFKFSPKLKLAITGMVLEGFISGSLFLVLYEILELIFRKNVSFQRICQLTIVVAILFVARLILYSISYTYSQIGGS